MAVRSDHLSPTKSAMDRKRTHRTEQLDLNHSSASWRSDTHHQVRIGFAFSATIEGMKTDSWIGDARIPICWKVRRLDKLTRWSTMSAIFGERSIPFAERFLQLDNRTCG